jgi:hypothetical protein
MSEPVRILTTCDDITADVVAEIESTVDWFDDEPSMPTEAFIDRLCDRYAKFDVTNYDNEAAREIMRIARTIRRNRT